MPNAVRHAFKWVLSLGVGALFVWLAFDEWPIDHLLVGGLRLEQGYLATDEWRVSIVTLGLYFLTLVSMHVFRVWRWQPLMKPLANVDFWTLNRVCSVGVMAVFLLPMRLGELVRPSLISTEVNVRRSPALATIVVERVVDGIMVAGFLAVALLFMPQGNTTSYLEIRLGTYLALSIFAGAVVTLVLMFAFRRQVTEAVKTLTARMSGRRWAVRLGGFVERFLMGLSIFPDVPNILWFFLLSFFYWFSNGIGLYLLAQGFEVSSANGFVGFDVPLLGAFAMMSTIVVGMMIPNAPANVGSFWYFLLKPIELYGVLPGNPAALAYALTVWSLQLLQLLIFGGWFIIRGQVSFGRAFAIGGAFQGEEEPGT